MNPTKNQRALGVFFKKKDFIDKENREPLFMFNHFTIKEDPRLSKVAQIVKEAKKIMHRGELNENEQLPSINRFSRQYSVSRDTVEKAYKVLKKEGYIAAVKGKGYFVTPRRPKSFKILLIFNKLSTFRNRRYDNLIFEPSGRINMDVRVYHNDLKIFRDIVRKNLASYHYYYIVLPPFRSVIKQRQANAIVDLIPAAKRLILQEKQ